MEFEIRRATAEDADGIARVHVDSWKSTYVGIVPNSYLDSLDVAARAEMWRKQLEKGIAATFVAETSTGIIGFISGGPLREPLSTYDGELYAIYLLHPYQRRGVGRALVFDLVKSLREDRFESIVVWVLEKNPAVSFYVKLGGIELMRKPIDIGGTPLEEIAIGWPTLTQFL